jgi:cell wall-associated NlpC family hydrolase
MWYRKAFQSSNFWNTDVSNDPKSIEDAFIGVIEDSKSRTSNPKDIYQNLKAYKKELESESQADDSSIDNAFNQAIEKLKSDFPSFEEESKGGTWLEEAKSWLGTPYRFGGDDRDGIDCSAFIQKVFEVEGEKLPRTTQEQINVGSEVGLDEQFEPGDRLFFAFGRLGKGVADHTGIYIGNNQFIQASSSKGVTISDVGDGSYYRDNLVAVRR